MISVGNLAVKHAVHDKICLLHLRLEGEPRDALKLSEWGREALSGNGEIRVPRGSV